MTDVSAHLIKDLREKTGAGMLDCKKALTEAQGDLEAAIDWLRKKGLAAASKKAGRVTAEGLVAVATSGLSGAVLEVNSETDFVARNEQFQGFVGTLLKLVVAEDIQNHDALLKARFEGTQTVEEALSLNIATIGESLSIRRLQRLAVARGVVASYVHGAAAPGMGKIGVLVGLESEAPADALQELGKQIAMHVAAANPLFLTAADVDASSLAKEKEILTEQARASGRPDEVIEKMVDGRLRKYFEEVVLEEQLFVMDGKTKITALLQEKSKALGHPIRLAGFVRMALGEGIEKVQSDFAAEVAAQAQ